jgi:hypothetical protein
MKTKTNSSLPRNSLPGALPAIVAAGLLAVIFANARGQITITVPPNTVQDFDGFVNASTSGTLTVTVGTSGTLNLNGFVSAPLLVKSGSGTLNIHGSLDAGMSLDVQQGTMTLDHSEELDDLVIGTIGTSGTMVVHAPLDVSGLTITGSGALDLTNSALVVRGGTESAITALVASGLHNGPSGYWDGPGIRSSAAAGDAPYLTAVGVLGSSQWGYWSFAGITGLTGEEILVGYTVYGDADMDGLVTGVDYGRIDTGFSGGLQGWYNGDFNYDGSVSGADYGLIDSSFPSCDTDGDGLPDWWEEFWLGGTASGHYDDGDLDYLTNADEFFYRTDPANADSDGDGFADWDELWAETNPNHKDNNDLDDDLDDDGVPNAIELAFGSDPYNTDSNYDGLDDGIVWWAGYSPIDPDLDDDGVSNADEIAAGLNPFYWDTDGDGVSDGADAFPLDPDLSEATPGDVTAPWVVNITYPTQGITPF